MQVWSQPLRIVPFILVSLGAVNLGLVSFAAEAAPAIQLKQGLIYQASLDPAELVPVVVFGKNSRQTPEEFAKDHHLDQVAVRRAANASGLIECGDAHGAGQLTLSTDVVTTAAHVFYDETGKQRAPACTFSLSVDGKDVRVPVELSSIVAGSKDPYAVSPVHDWAVAHLAHHVPGVTPYTIATGLHGNEEMTFVARGHIDWGGGRKLSMEECKMHDEIAKGAEGTREFSFDCDTGDGASGGALMFNKGRTEIGAVLVGWLSNHPSGAIPFCGTHYNFAVTMEGEFRRAVISAAGGNMMVENREPTASNH